MKPLVVTFDCASTLVRVKWTPGGFAVDCARAAGLEIAEEERAAYEKMLRYRWSDYQDLNQTRDPQILDGFWLQLTEDWLRAIGKPASLAAEMTAAAPALLYGKNSDMFLLYDDVLPIVDILSQRGIRLGVLSNWDYSLHRVLKALDVNHRFEFVFASLEEGFEKPDPRLFQLALDRFGVTAADAVHVGDDPLDDFRGAQDAGIRAYLIDRSHPASRGAVLARLTDLVEALDRD